MCFVQSLDFNLPNSLSFTECGGNVSGQTNGVIHSPNYPEKYATSSEAASIQCHWFIHVNPGHKVMMYFETFEVEGNPTGIVDFSLFWAENCTLPWKCFEYFQKIEVSLFWIPLLAFFDLDQFIADRGCPSATLRVWPWKEKDKTPLELCGDSLDQHTEITSQTNLMRVS